VRRVRLFAKASAITLVTLALLAAVVALIATTVPSGDYLLLPAPAQPLAALVHVSGQPPALAASGAGILYVAIMERRATTLESWFGPSDRGAQLVPASLLFPPGASQQSVTIAGQADMCDSQHTATAVAERAAGLAVRNGGGALVCVAAMDGGSPAAQAGIRPGDVIVAVNNHSVGSVAELRRLMSGARAGSVVAVTYLRSGRAVTVPVTTRPLPGSGHAGLGVVVSDNVKVPVAVTYDIGDVEGPSAGLAFALQVYASLTHNAFIRGRRIAATGELALDGSVLPIGGAAQKAIGASDAGASLFLVPTANVSEAARTASRTTRVIGVSSFADALRVLHASA
jgi:Lon-like protease